MFRTGNLTIRPIEAKLLHDTERFGKMDPYIKFMNSDIIEKTPVAKKQHLNPFWNCEFVLRMKGDTMLKIEVWNKELLTKDDLIGTCSIPIFDWLAKGQSNHMREWLPLFFKDTDAGALLLEMTFFPDGDVMGVTQGMAASTTYLSESLGGSHLQPGIQQQGQFGGSRLQGQQPLGFGNIGLAQSTLYTGGTTYVNSGRPNIVTETQIIQETPEFVQERPIIYEKDIHVEKPIIINKEIVESTQPILITKPEARQNIITEVQQPVVMRDTPVLRQELGSENLSQLPNLEGAFVQKETQFQREAPEFINQRPELYKKDIITEKPIIHEKDIINREIPVVIEKPEIVQKVMNFTQPTQTITQDTIIHPEAQYYTNTPVNLRQEPVFHHQGAEVRQDAPLFVKEQTDVYEKKIVHEKPIIHEQPILHTQKEVIQEKPEFYQTRIIQQEPTIRRVDPMINKTLDQSNPTLYEQQQP